MMASPTESKQERRPLWKKLLWCICFPFILVWYSITIYLVPCITVYVDRVFGAGCLKIGDLLCCCCWCRFWKRQSKCVLCEFEDGEFPAEAQSLGEWGGRARQELEHTVKWIRGKELCSSNGDRARLFSKGIGPSDIAQGQLGNCWLLASLACAAEYPGAIQRCFSSKQYNHRGRYTVKLYDGKEKKWLRIVVDDFIPTEQGKPLFAQPNGTELWVLLIEKAFAKYCGSYQALQGGLMLWGLEAITGDNVLHFSLHQSQWVKHVIRHFHDATNKRKAGIHKVEPVEQYNHDDFFDLLVLYDKQHSVIGAGSTKGGRATDQALDARSGICQGHAYSVIRAKKVDNFQLLKLRNPWGFFEWKGDWSDKSQLWEKHKNVGRACGRETRENGIFWIEMKDFVRYFDQVDICHRSTGVQDLVLDVGEDEGCSGPCKGCVKGCCKYYCCCRGCVALCFARKSTLETAKVGKFPSLLWFRQKMFGY